MQRTIGICVMLLALISSLLGAAFMSAQPASAQGEPERVAFDHDLVVQKDDTVKDDVSVTNGNLIIYGTVEGKATVVNGEALIYGKVMGDVAVLSGKGVTLYPKSSVAGNVLASGDISLNNQSLVNGSVTSFGGQVIQDPGAVVKGSVNTVQNPAAAIQNLVQPNQLQSDSSDISAYTGPFSRITGMFSIGILSVLILLLSVGVASVIPNRVRTASATLQAEPGPSIVVGIITAFLIFPVAGLVAAILAISIVGIVLLPVLAVALLGAFLVGFVVVSHWLGRHLHDSTRQGGAAPSRFGHQVPTLIVEVLLGVAMVLASTLIPVLFLPTWISMLMFVLVYSIACIGIGSTILSRFGTLAPPKLSHKPRIIYPTAAHSHYGSSLPHRPPMQIPVGMAVSPERTSTRPLGPAPALPREE